MCLRRDHSRRGQNSEGNRSDKPSTIRPSDPGVRLSGALGWRQGRGHIGLDTIDAACCRSDSSPRRARLLGVGRSDSQTTTVASLPLDGVGLVAPWKQRRRSRCEREARTQQCRLRPWRRSDHCGIGESEGSGVCRERAGAGRDGGHGRAGMADSESPMLSSPALAFRE